MKHVSILVPEGDCSITNIEGTHQILSRVNDYLADLGRPPAFTINLVGRRNLERRFKQATGNTVMEYIQRVKMEVVKKSLETSRLGVSETMNKVGYSDPKPSGSFSKK